MNAELPPANRRRLRMVPARAHLLRFIKPVLDPIDCAGTCCERKIKPAGFRAKLNRRRHEFHHMQAGRHLDAQICCERASALDAGHADTLHLMGLLSLHAKQYDAAIEWIDRANRADLKRDYLLSLGTALEQQGLQTGAEGVRQNGADEAGRRRIVGTVRLRARPGAPPGRSDPGLAACAQA
jgi:tetratricopeptide (TPR) repeat protein